MRWVVGLAVLLSLVAGGVAGASALDASAPVAVAAAPTTTATTTSTTLALSTTVAPTVTSTTVEPLVRPRAVTVPTPPPAEEPVDDPIARAAAALAAVVPARWLSVVPVRFTIVPGSVSLSHDDGRIEVAEGHLDGPVARLQFVLAHEFGHQLAYRYGTGAYFGAAPAGFPAAGAHPEEYWADCVATAFTGAPLADHGCAGDALAFTSDWLAQGAPA